ncbi:MAG: hypothetical protein KAS59_05390 [Alphaproteobacteria bacterium]|nr:hypothetical protein [Alphaproteobacteria bacterium]
MAFKPAFGGLLMIYLSNRTAENGRTQPQVPDCLSWVVFECGSVLEWAAYAVVKLLAIKEATRELEQPASCAI